MGLHRGLRLFEIAVAVGFEEELADVFRFDGDFEAGDVGLELFELGGLEERSVFGDLLYLAFLHPAQFIYNKLNLKQHQVI